MALLSRRIEVEGKGAGLVIDVRRALGKPTTHVIDFDDGSRVALLLDKGKGDGRGRPWHFIDEALVSPSTATEGDAQRSPVGSSARAGEGSARGEAGAIAASAHRRTEQYEARLVPADGGDNARLPTSTSDGALTVGRANGSNEPSLPLSSAARSADFGANLPPMVLFCGSTSATTQHGA